MTTDDSDDYPRAWRPRERVDRDAAFEPTEAELWLASLSDREFPGPGRPHPRRPAVKVNALLVGLTDCERLLSALEALSVTPPKQLTEVLSAREKLAAVPPVVNPVKELIAAALDGRATPDKVDRALERAALARLIASERVSLDQRIEPELTVEFG
jgi:hypothetical protein